MELGLLHSTPECTVGVMSLQDIYCSGNGEQTHATVVYQELRVIFGHIPWEIASGYVLLQYI